MRNKLKYIVIVLLAALSILVGVKDYNTTMDAKHTIEQIYDEAEGDLSKSQKAKIKKYDDLIKDRWYTLFFVCFYFGVVTVLTLSAGKRKKEQKRISQEEAKAIISEISKELIENNYVVTGNVQMNVGVYTVSASLIDVENYEWSDGSVSVKN